MLLVPGSPNPGQKNKKKPKASQTSKVSDITTIRANEKLRLAQKMEEQKLQKKQQRREVLHGVLFYNCDYYLCQMNC